MKKLSSFLRSFTRDVKVRREQQSWAEMWVLGAQGTVPWPPDTSTYEVSSEIHIRDAAKYLSNTFEDHSDFSDSENGKCQTCECQGVVPRQSAF